jgi:hypothetical protein
MKRFHVHVSVPDLKQSIRFYSTLFGSEPAVVKDDYAKWMLEDPRVNFAISERGGKAGINHLGLQTDSDAELEALHDNLQQADVSAHAEQNISCCYARSNKYWVTDPSGIAWETFHTLGSVPTFGGEEPESATPAAGCCGSVTAKSSTSNSARASSACCG